MKKLSTLPSKQSNQEIKGYSNEISLFALSGDKLLEPENAEYIKEEVNRLLTKVPTEWAQNSFLAEVYRIGMTKKQFTRALHHAWNTPTYGDKGLLNAITSYDKTIKTFSHNGVLKLLNDGTIERTSDMIKVQFSNFKKGYIYKTDFVEGLMIIAEATKPEDKKERYYIDPETKEKFIV